MPLVQIERFSKPDIPSDHLRGRGQNRVVSVDSSRRTVGLPRTDDSGVVCRTLKVPLCASPGWARTRLVDRVRHTARQPIASASLSWRR
jgi:hypothetical protein